MWSGIRTFADCMHLLSFVIIIYKLVSQRNCKGVSLKTQEIYLVVFCSRYLDLFFYYISFYNTFMKISFITCTVIIIYLIRLRPGISETYSKDDDDLPHHYLFLFAFIAALIVHTQFSWWEMTWSFSLWLEAVAIFPQINVLTKLGGAEAFILHYIAALGSYRFFYILFWAYRYSTDGYICWTSVLSGILQVALYVDFFVLYIKK
jgi:ER lumen protein retaining receptor